MKAICYLTSSVSFLLIFSFLCVLACHSPYKKQYIAKNIPKDIPIEAVDISSPSIIIF